MIAQRTLLTGGQLVLLALAALFAATTVNGVIAIAMAPRPTLDLEPPAAFAEAPRKRPLGYYAPITNQDVFNPPKPPEAEPVTVSTLKAKLLGTAPGHGMDSYAIIEDGTTRKQELYRVGDQIQNRTLARVEWDRVILKNGNREEILKIEEMKGGPAVAAAAGAVSEGIETVGENEFVIDRAEVDEAMQNMNQLFTQIRAVPHFQEGKANGFRLFAIRRNSVFEKIGLKNGDIVTAINGNPLTDPARAMQLFQELKDEGQVQVEVTRNRQPTTLNYEIRG